MSGVEALPWDSELWGRRVARVRFEMSADDPTAYREDLLAARHGFDFVQTLLPLDRVAHVHAAEDLGFRLVDVRCVVTLDADRHVRPPSPAEVELRDAGDVDDAAALAGRCHTISRFASDPMLDRATVQELYRRWVHRDAATTGWQVAVTVRDQVVTGYVTYGVDASGAGTIGVIGVDEGERGSGLGRNLVEHATSWCFAQGAERMEVVTQAGNRAAMDMYRRVGYEVRELGLWLHWHRHRLPS